MRKSVVVLLLTVLLALWSAAPIASAETTTIMLGETPQQLMDRMRVEALNGHIDAAISELSDFVRAHPSLVAPARLLGDLYYRKPDVTAAQRVYRDILTRFPDDRETWNRLGGVYAVEDRIDDAIAAFNRSIPEPSAYPNLVVLHQRRGDLHAFEEQVATEASSSPNDELTLLNYGNVLRAVHKYAKAITVFGEALSLHSGLNRCAALNDLANVYLDLKQADDAIPLLNRCLDVDPDTYYALVNIGVANIYKQRFDEARSYLNHALRSKADRPEVYVDLGYLEDVGGRWKSAIEYYQKALTVDPFSRDAYVNLGYDYNEQKLYPLAEAAFLKGLSISPGDGRLAYLLGQTYSEQGKTDLAKRQYKTAVREGNEQAVIQAAQRALVQLGSRTSKP
jgi:protein O-GlcNAc transferase